MSSIAYSMILAACQISKLYFLTMNFELIRISEYAVASTLGISLTILLYLWMKRQIRITASSYSDKNDWLSINLILIIFKNVMFFLIVAFILYLMFVNYWITIPNDNLEYILLFSISFSPIAVLAITIVEFFLSNKKIKSAIFLLACSSFINLVSTLLLDQWLDINAYFAGSMIGLISFIMLAYTQRIFTLKDCLYSYSKCRSSSFFFRIWLVIGSLHLAVQLSLAACLFLTIVQNSEIHAIIFLGAGVCFAASQFVLVTGSIFLQNFSTTSKTWSELERSAYEKIIWIFWDLGSGVMAAVFFLTPLASYILPLPVRQFFVDCVWILCVVYWIGLFITPAYLLISSHDWNQRLSTHVLWALFQSVTFALFGLLIQGFWGGILGVIIGSIVGAISFSRQAHTHANRQYESWTPEIEGQAVFSILLMVAFFVWLMPLEPDDFFATSVFASYSLIVVAIAYARRASP